MKTDTEVTRVVFRTWRSTGASTIALFPDLPADVNGLYCSSYEHIGQHGAADYHGVIARTRPACAEEIAPLRRELQSIGYHLQERKRR